MARRKRSAYYSYWKDSRGRVRNSRGRFAGRSASTRYKKWLDAHFRDVFTLEKGNRRLRYKPGVGPRKHRYVSGADNRTYLSELRTERSAEEARVLTALEQAHARLEMFADLQGWQTDLPYDPDDWVPYEGLVYRSWRGYRRVKKGKGRGYKWSETGWQGVVAIQAWYSEIVDSAELGTEPDTTHFVIVEYEMRRVTRRDIKRWTRETRRRKLDRRKRG